MVSTMKERYEELKRYSNILLNHDEILLYYPDYYKTKVELEKENFISKVEVDEEFINGYKKTELYKKLVKVKLDNDQIYDYMNTNKNVKYNSFKIIFESAVRYSIKLCELIDYIGHYPSTYPVPKKEEKNKEMEVLLEKYDIIVRYHLGDDMDYMQITSDDIVRIIEKLTENLKMIYSMKESIKNGDWLFTKKLSQEEMEEKTKSIIEEIEKFPLSDYQLQNKSKREEGKMYLRRQHGKNII